MMAAAMASKIPRVRRHGNARGNDRASCAGLFVHCAARTSSEVALLPDSSRKPRLSVVLHGAWAIPGVAATLFFATATGGHPPGIVFLPLVLFVWAVGHLAIWGGTRLAGRAASCRGVGTRLPVTIAIATVLAGIMSAAGALLVISTLFSGRGTSGGVETGLLVAIWLGHVAVFAGLLGRAVWGRVLAAIAALGWMAVVVTQVADHLVHRRPIDPLEMPLAVVVIAALGFLAYRLLTGSAEQKRTSAAGTEDTAPPVRDVSGLES